MLTINPSNIVSYLTTLFKFLPLIVLFCIIVKNRRGLRRFIKKEKSTVGVILIIIMCITSISYSIYCKLESIKDNAAVAAAKDAENFSRKLPGTWKSLYDQIVTINAWEARMLAFESFCNKDAQNEVPLPAAGFDILVQQLYDGSWTPDAQWKYINRARDAAKKWVSAFPEALTTHE